MGPQL